MRDEHPAARATAVAAPSLNVHLPGPRENSVRVLGIHRYFGCAGVLIYEEHALPSLAPVFCAEDAPLGLRSITGSKCGYEHYVGIVWIDDDAADAASGV